MKKLLFLCGMILILPWHAKSQDIEYLSKQDFQVEKKRLVESIYRLNKNNQELKSMLLFEVQANDSLAQLVALQSEKITSQDEVLKQLESAQSDLDDRLLTQRKSGTLIAILVPVGLFLLFLLLLIWLIIFRHRTLSMLSHLDDRLNELSKRLDDQLNTFKREHDAIRSEVQISRKDAENRVQKLSGEIEGRLQNIEQLIKEEQASHDIRHQELHQEYEAFKGSLQKGYDSLTADLTKLKAELSSTAKELTNRLKEMIKQNPG